MSRINYDLNLIKGIVFDVDGVLSPSTIPMNEDGMPMRMVNIKDGYALQLAVKKGLKLAIITGGKAEGIVARYRSLGLTDIYMGVALKIDVMKEWMDSRGLKPEEVAYVGDDIPDYECMLLAGLKVAPRDAAVDIKGIADYITPCDGGNGVARDLIEQLLRARGEWLTRHDAFGW